MTKKLTKRTIRIKKTGDVYKDLKVWIDYNFETQTAAAEHFEVTRPYLNHLMHGRRYPSEFLRKLIDHLSSGYVPYDKWPKKCPNCDRPMPS